MDTEHANRSGRALSAAASAFVLVALGVASMGLDRGAVAVQPAQTQRVAFRGGDLEKAFWVCDYTATVKGVSATPIDICAGVTEDLKNEKFGGDFDEMVKWWNQRKVAEHRNLAEQGL
jgi:hypothetical protein